VVYRNGTDWIAENPVTTSSKDTSSSTLYKQDDFLKLDPVAGKPTESFSDNNTTGATGESSMPIVPLTQDIPTPSAGTTDKAGVSDKLWKPTALDEVKPSGAPGAGPSAPSDYTVATPDLSSSTSNKAAESTEPAFKDTAKDTTSSESAHDTPASEKHQSKAPAPSEPPTQHSVGNEIDAILESVPKSKHSVPDSEANDPASHMAGKTVRQTEASQHGESGNSKSTCAHKAGHLLNSADGIAGLASEKVGDHSESHGSAAHAGEEKSGKMSELKEKFKNKLHIGHKDK
jgi:hypothetical protein